MHCPFLALYASALVSTDVVGVQRSMPWTASDKGIVENDVLENTPKRCALWDAKLGPQTAFTLSSIDIISSLGTNPQRGMSYGLLG